ncbi:MAG: hypothetical protein MPJ52_04435, partial [Alphaproteobacteria bacterium]|nr:hypothetical protein [Alphaproteobacteria bacterium]
MDGELSRVLERLERAVLVSASRRRLERGAFREEARARERLERELGGVAERLRGLAARLDAEAAEGAAAGDVS